MDSHETTMHGLRCWYKAEFEKLGWMVLAKNDGYQDKIDLYKKGLQRLADALEAKMMKVQDPDRKDDLQIMHNKTKILIAHVDKDFPTVVGGKKKASKKN